MLAERSLTPPEIRRSPRRYCSFGEGPTAELRESSVLLPKIMSFLLSEREGSGWKTDRLFKYCEQRNNRSAPDESKRNATNDAKTID